MNQEKELVSFKNRFIKFLKLTILLIFLLCLAVIAYLYFFPCKLPTHYTIGTIDSGFNISRDQAKKDALEAETRWEKATGVDMFTYDDNASLKIDFVYSDTQAKTNDMVAKLAQYNLATTELKTLGQQVDAEKASYEADLTAYNTKTQAHNTAVAAVNQSTAQSTINQLNTEKTTLDNTLKSLQKRKADLDNKIDIYNQKVVIQNQYTDQYNQAAKQDAGQSFIAGLHLGNIFTHHISLYTFENDEQLTELMMHEMGHEFIHEHASQPESIMYYQVNDKQTGQPSTEDVNLFCSICRAKKK